jgi:mRNA degradation ribonuclease J1/J2
VRSHVSGHASRPELKELIEKLNPKLLFPVHTERPEVFAELVKGEDIEVIIPELDTVYSF